MTHRIEVDAETLERLRHSAESISDCLGDLDDLEPHQEEIVEEQRQAAANLRLALIGLAPTPSPVDPWYEAVRRWFAIYSNHQDYTASERDQALNEFIGHMEQFALDLDALAERAGLVEAVVSDASSVLDDYDLLELEGKPISTVNLWHSARRLRAFDEKRKGESGG